MEDPNDPSLRLGDEGLLIPPRGGVTKKGYSIDSTMVRRVAKCAYLFEVSESAVLEAALRRFFWEHKTDDELRKRLAEAGATKRRR